MLLYESKCNRRRGYRGVSKCLSQWQNQGIAGGGGAAAPEGGPLIGPGCTPAEPS